MVETNKSDSSALRTVLGSFSSRHIGLNEKEKKDVILVDQNFKYSHIYIKNFTTEVDTNKSERFTEILNGQQALFEPKEFEGGHTIIII